MQNVCAGYRALPVQVSQQSPIDQIVEEEATFQCRAGGGTDSPGSTSGTSSSGSSGYPVSALICTL